MVRLRSAVRSRTGAVTDFSIGEIYGKQEKGSGRTHRLAVLRVQAQELHNFKEPQEHPGKA